MRFILTFIRYFFKLTFWDNLTKIKLNINFDPTYENTSGCSA